MLKTLIKTGLICTLTTLLLATPVSALETFKVSNYGGGAQIWFEVEDYDLRDPDTDAGFALTDEPDAFGRSITQTSGSDGNFLMRYDFDISAAGGSGGTWYFWGRVINPNNRSSFMVVDGHPGDPTVTGIPVTGLSNGMRVFEDNIGTVWTWANDNANEGHTKTLRDGLNTMHIIARETNGIMDVFMWTDDPAYVPTDEDYINAQPPARERAGKPSPAKDAVDVPYYTETLRWSPGEFAATHTVYFGTNFDDVNTASAAAQIADGITETSVAVNTDLETTYYWRVDEVNGAPDFTVHAGEVWSFTVEAVANLITTVTATSDSEFGPATGADKVVDGSGLTDGLHGTAANDMWQSAGLPATITFDLGALHVLHEMKVWNQNQLIEALLGLGAKDVTIELSTNGTDFTAVEGVGPLNQATGAPGSGPTDTIALDNAPASVVRLTINSGHGPLPNVGLAEVQFTSIPVSPRELSPSDGTVLVGLDADLSWRAGRFTSEHQVLFSGNRDAVTDGSAVVTTTAEKSHTVTADNFGASYFWQIVDLTADGAAYPSDILQFDTPDRAVIDDMESYKDEEFLEIWATWMDGFEDPANGAIVGNIATGSPEMGIVHGGRNSMPLNFDNRNAPLSEVTRAFDPAQDWTKGIQTVGLWFHGEKGNTGQLYAKINDVKILYDGDEINLASPSWQPWNIDLAASGVDATRVTSLTIGVEGNGFGTLYIDDIVRFIHARQLNTPADPGATDLVAYYALDQDTSDGSGNGHNGTIEGNPIFQSPGWDGTGSAMEFGANENRITVESFDVAGTGITLSAWIKPRSFQNDARMISKSEGGGTNFHYWAMVLSGAGEDTLQFRLRTDQGNTTSHTSGGQVEAGEWSHVAATWDASDPVMREYINGRQVGSTNKAGTAVATGPGVKIGIGNQSISALAESADSAVRPYDGLLDEVRVYERGLTPAEVSWQAGRVLPFDEPL